jgi:hypothetical protein
MKKVMLAVAHKIRRAIERGELRDQAEAARRLGLTRARLTQILDLTLLAPNLQEEILFLKVIGGVEPLRERALRGVVRVSQWAAQRAVDPPGRHIESPNRRITPPAVS